MTAKESRAREDPPAAIRPSKDHYEEKDLESFMEFIRKNWSGILLCLIIAVPSSLLGNMFPIIGGPVIAILAGMIITLLIRDKSSLQSGITFTSKKILQYAVIFLGFGLNLSVILSTGRQSLPIIVSTIAASLIISYILCRRVMKIPGRISTRIGVGSSICGGSAIAATAPVIDADDEEVAQSISVIFFFNVLAAILFPSLGAHILGFSHDAEAFGIFAGTAVNDTSSVTAAASTWDTMFGLGSATLDKAVTVKLTRTLAIIPITLVLAFWRTKKERSSEGVKVSLKSIFPFFILVFRAGIRHHNSFSGHDLCGYHHRRSGGPDHRFLFFYEAGEQVFHRHGDGGHRPEYQHRQTRKIGRKADFHGALLLGGHRLCQPRYAACSGHMVNYFLYGETAGKHRICGRLCCIFCLSFFLSFRRLRDVFGSDFIGDIDSSSGTGKIFRISRRIEFQKIVGGNIESQRERIKSVIAAYDIRLVVRGDAESVAVWYIESQSREILIEIDGRIAVIQSAETDSEFSQNVGQCLALFHTVEDAVRHGIRNIRSRYHIGGRNGYCLRCGNRNGGFGKRAGF